MRKHQARLATGAALTIAAALAGCGHDAGVTGPSVAAGAFPATVVVFGDSILADSGFAARLRARLTAAGADTQIVDATRPGEKTAQGVARLASMLATIPAGATVLILEGTNDYRSDGAVDTVGNLTAMVEAVAARGSRAIVGTMPPAGPMETRPARQAWIAETNERLRVALSGRADVADVHAAIMAQYGPALYVDHLHLSGAGAEILLDAFWNVLADGR